MIADIHQASASPLSLHRHLPERSSRSRVRFAAQTQRALDRSGPFRNLISEKGKGANAKPPHPELPQIRPPPLDDVNNRRS
jgi:hypothetical protein